MNKYLIAILSLSVLLLGCAAEKQLKNPLKMVLASDHPKIKRVMDSLEQFDVQILYTQVDRRNDSIVLTDYYFQTDESNYFYPASTVKFPIAVLALEKLQRIDSLNRQNIYYLEGDSIENSFEEDVSKIFAVSDNHANNRLLEFLGQDAINDGLIEKGISPVRISHRLGYHTDDVTTKPLIIYLNDSTTTTTQPIINKVAKPLQLNKINKGRGYYENDSLMLAPFDFSLKNYYPISSQHAVLKRIVFPELFDENKRFKISPSQREFLMSSMHTLPRKLGYDPEEYYDGYCKFFMYGDTRDRIPENVRIYNKVGFAYGTLTDCAYITDSTNEVEFLLTATILVNQDQIFNDDNYEYDEIGIPFLAELGREIYAQELKRKENSVLD